MPSPTSAGRRELGAPHESQVSGASPECLRRVAEAQAGVEVVGLERLVVVDGVVATGCVGAVHPNLCRDGGNVTSWHCSHLEHQPSAVGKP